MYQHLSSPIRRRIIALLRDKGKSYRYVAEALGVGTATVNRVWRHFRLTGQYQKPLRRGAVKAVIKPDEHQDFHAMLAENATATYDELSVKWFKRMKKKVSRSAILRLAKKLGYTRKNKSLQVSQKLNKKQRARQAKFRFLSKTIAANKLVFLDESGFQARSSRLKALSLRGTRAYVFEPMMASKNITITGAIRLSGPVLMHGQTRLATRKSFLSLLKCRLLPRLKPKDVLVLDNLSAHKGKDVRRLCRAWDVRLFYLPPYCPEYDPIEKVWNWMKLRLRGRINRAVSNFRYAISGAWRKSAELPMKSLFRNAGYLPSPQVN